MRIGVISNGGVDLVSDALALQSTYLQASIERTNADLMAKKQHLEGLLQKFRNKKQAAPKLIIQEIKPDEGLKAQEQLLASYCSEVIVVAV